MKKLLTAVLLCFLFAAFGATGKEPDWHKQDLHKARLCTLIVPSKTLNPDRGYYGTEYFCMVPLQTKRLGVIHEILGEGAERICRESQFSWVIISKEGHVSGVVAIKACKSFRGTLQIEGNGDFNPLVEEGITGALHLKFPNAKWFVTAIPGSEEEKCLLYREYVKIPGNSNSELEKEAVYIRPSTVELQRREKVMFFPYGKGREVSVGVL